MVEILQAIEDYPYVGVALIFLLCGIGLPLPEELVLITSGYLCAAFPEKATLPLMMAWCAGAIMAGDMLPYVLGRTFGPRLLRVRWLRVFATKKRLGSFDRWFRRRGDLVIFIARFLPGIRSVAFFTAGTMKMALPRFLLLDGLGIAVIVPVLTLIGYHSASYIDVAIQRVVQVERGILWAVGSVVAIGALWYWLWRRRHRARAARAPAETYIEPQLPVEGPPLPDWMLRPQPISVHEADEPGTGEPPAPRRATPPAGEETPPREAPPPTPPAP